MVQPLNLPTRKPGDDTFDADIAAIADKIKEAAEAGQKTVRVKPARKNVVNKGNAVHLALTELAQSYGLAGPAFELRTDTDTSVPSDDVNAYADLLDRIVALVNPPPEPVVIIDAPLVRGVTSSVADHTASPSAAYNVPNGVRPNEAPVLAGERWVAFPGTTGDYRFATPPAPWQVVAGSERLVTAGWQSGIVAWWRDITQADITAGLPATLTLTLNTVASQTPATARVGTLDVHRVTGGSRATPPTAATVGGDLGVSEATHPGVTVTQDGSLVILGVSGNANTAMTWNGPGPEYTGKVTSFAEAGNNDVQRAQWRRENTPAGATGPLTVTFSPASRRSMTIVTLDPQVTTGDETGAEDPTRVTPTIVGEVKTTVTSSSVTDVFTTNVPCSRATEYRLATDTGARTPHDYTSPLRTDHSATTPLPAADTLFDIWYVLTSDRGVETTVGPFSRRTAPAVAPPTNTGSGVSFKYDEPQLTNPLQFTAGGSNGFFRTYDTNRDVLVTCTSEVVKPSGATGLSVVGGNRVLIRNPSVYHAQDNAPTSGSSKSNRGLTIQGNGSNGSITTTTRQIFVRDLKLRGVMKDGLIVDLGGDKNVELIVDGFDASGVTSWPGGPGDQNHPDLIQMWNGPLKARFNRIWAPNMSYQGVFMQQREFGREDAYESWFDNVHVGGTSTAAYLLWSSHDSALHINENAPDSVTVYSVRFGPTVGQPGGVSWDRVLWDSRSGGAGYGRWRGVRYAQRTKAEVLGA